MKNKYVCLCGSQFKSASGLSGHMLYCKTFRMFANENFAFNDNLEQLKNLCSRIIRNIVEEKKMIEDQRWIKEKHLCEKCGKIMTEKYGSGRFCCKACANSRTHSAQTKAKMRASAIKYAVTHPDDESTFLHNHEKALRRYNQNPKHCPICNTIISYERRFQHTCGNQDCISEKISQNARHNPKCGGLKKKSGTGKSGWYKGYFCNSTYELVYVIYNIDHDISFKRFKDFYTYEWNGKTYKYYPDFELKDGSLVEIKGYFTEKVAAKTAAVKDRKITVLYKDDLKYAFDWVKEHYQYKELQDLYESNSSNK